MTRKWYVKAKHTISISEKDIKPALNVTIKSPDDSLTQQPNNPFVAVATVTGQMGSPIAWLVDMDANRVNPSSAPTSSGNDWTFKFGAAGNPIAAGYYLLTVQAINGADRVRDTVPVLVKV